DREALDGLTAQRGGDVDGDVIAVDRGPLHLLEGGRRPAETVDLAGDVVVADLWARDLDPEPPVAGHLDRGPDLDHRVEDDGAVVLTSRDVDRRRGDDVDAVLVDGPHV